MTSIQRRASLLGLSVLFALPWAASQTGPSAQTSTAASAPGAVPPLVPYSGVALDERHKPLTAAVSIGFFLYKEEQGGEPLFAETQTLTADLTGHYTAQLGATNPNGLPQDLFSNGEARWLEVQIAGQPPQPRVLLASVPFAMKAGDSATLGGLPASAFALAGQSGRASTAENPGPNAVSNVTTTGGTAGYIPRFSGAASIVNSPIFVSGGNVGIGTTTPSTSFQVIGNTVVTGGMTVNGTSTFNGQFLLPAPGTATATAAYNSQLFKIYTSAYNSSTHAAVSPRFQWQGEVAGNNTANPSATLNLLTSTTSNPPTETGFHFNANGTINFAAGQTFPGAGHGTITGVAAGAGLAGGGTTGTVTLAINPAAVPQLATANSFGATQSIASGNLNLPATSGAGSGVINIGGVPFLHGYTAANHNVFMGGAGNFTTTGTDTVASGHDALEFQTTGGNNTGVGAFALFATTTGGNNTGVGQSALKTNTTGSGNTAVGYLAGPSSAALTNTTALGANATVGQSNTLVLGQTTAGSPGKKYVNVGIGTDRPRSIEELSVNALNAVGPVLTLTNSRDPDWAGPDPSNTPYTSAAAIDFNTYLPSAAGTYNPSARIEAIDTNYDVGGGDGGYLNFHSSDLVFLSNAAEANNLSKANQGLRQNMTINSFGQVGIPDLPFDGLTYFPVGQLIVTGNDLLDYQSNPGIVSTGGQGTNSYYSVGGDGGDFFGGLTGPGYHSSAGDGIQATAGGSGDGSVAGNFIGDVTVSGTLSAGAKNFKIDHPGDPANKYLVHSSIESSEMVNIYSGNITTDELGLAIVQLPNWFELENGDFRYQLTVIDGRFAQAVISKQIANHQFTISTNASRVKVSWQVTGVRQDAYAKAHPMVVEERKTERERGFYLHPELYGQPEERQTQWGRRPRLMQQMKTTRERQKLNGHQSFPEPVRHRGAASAVNVVPANQPGTKTEMATIKP